VVDQEKLVERLGEHTGAGRVTQFDGRSRLLRSPG
jgi:hypothetical protein